MKNYRSSGFLNDEYEKKYAKKFIAAAGYAPRPRPADHVAEEREHNPFF